MSLIREHPRKHPPTVEFVPVNVVIEPRFDTEVKLLQLRNAASSMDVKFGRLMSPVSALHPPKDWFPIVDNALFQCTVVNDVQPWKAYICMVVSFEGKYTYVSEVLFLNTPPYIEFEPAMVVIFPREVTF